MKPSRGWKIVDISALRNPPELFVSIVYVILIFILFIFLYFIFATIYRLIFVVTIGSPDDLNKLLLSVAGLIGAPFVVWRVLIAAKAIHISNENLYTNMLTRAVEQLGAMREIKESRNVTNPPEKPQWENFSSTVSNIEVRLGAIYALEKISRDYEPLHWPIMEVLCAYVRNNSAKAVAPTQEVLDLYAGRGINQFFAWQEYINRLKAPATDVQAAISVIGRRSHDRRRFENEWRSKKIDGQAYQLNFVGADLTRIDFRGLYFAHADFRGCNLEAAEFDEAILDSADFGGAHAHGCKFTYAKLSNARLEGVQITGAVFDNADLHGANLSLLTGACASFQNCNATNADFNWSDMLGANFRAADLSGADLTMISSECIIIDGANLSDTIGFDAERLEMSWGNAHTILPDGHERPQNNQWSTNELTWRLDWRRNRARKAALVAALKSKQQNSDEWADLPE